MRSSHNISYLSGRTATSDVWIGLNDLGFSGLFSWSDHHEVTFTYWAPGEPNNHLGFDEDCVELFHQVLMRYKAQEPNVLNTGAWMSSQCFASQSGRWNDVTCTELNTYICKTPKGHYPLPSIQPTIYGCPQVSHALSWRPRVTITLSH